MTSDGEPPYGGAPGESEPDPDFDDFASRQLCDDGACTGVVGGDGACRKCGRIAAPPGAPDATPPTLVEDAETVSPSLSDDEGGFEEERRLCPDGECIGLIGDDGLCRECGRAAK